jgi:predicted AAA+ superfamily ATPase
MIVNRPFWVERIRAAWKQAPIVWLSGVRRVGKTTLCQALEHTRFINCDLPRSAQILEDPELFYASVSEPIVVFDEIHQLPDPSRLLKIGSDNFPKLKILATGSSTLAATKKFRDTLAGRKRLVHLLPVLAEELPDFGVRDLQQRLLRGGLPQALLAGERQGEFYAEWFDSFYARDIQELFRVEKRTGFLLLVETLLRQSGGLMEVASLSKMCGLSRPTVMNYLEVLQVTHAIQVLRPFHGGGRQELLHQPKVYGFDTGFIAHARGWEELRAEDRGPLWEHLVLDTLISLPDARRPQFWRDKQQREVDFVLPRGRGGCDAIECKWSPAAFDPKGLAAFRAIHPRGRNFVVTPQIGEAFERESPGMKVTFTGLLALRRLLAGR